MGVTTGSWRVNRNKSVDPRPARGKSNNRGTPTLTKEYMKSMAAEEKKEDNLLRSDYGRKPKKFDRSREPPKTNKGQRERDIKFSPYIDNSALVDTTKTPKPKKKKVDDIVNRLYNGSNAKPRR